MNYLDKFRLQSKVSLVTGGAGGIGEEICKALLDAGSKVILADIDEKKGLKIVKSLSKKNKNIFFYKLDATSQESIVSIKNKILNLYIPLKILLFFLFLQIILGILTLISGLNIFLASMHQITSVLLVLSAINLYYLRAK